MLVPKTNRRRCYRNGIRHHPLGEINKSFPDIRGIGHSDAVDLSPVEETSNQLLAAFSDTSKALRCLLRIEPGWFLFRASHRALVSLSKINGTALKPKAHNSPRKWGTSSSDRIAMIEAEAVTAAPDLRNWLISLAVFARRAVDRHVGVVFVIS
jgi:hypothetical protein